MGRESKTFDLGANRAEQHFREQATWLQAILNSLSDAIITVHPDGRIESLNSAAESMFGYSADEVVGHDIQALLPMPLRDKYNQSHCNCPEMGATKSAAIDREDLAVRKNGNVFPIELTVTEVQLREQRLRTVVVRDMSARKRCESDLIAANRELARRTASIERFNKQLARSNDDLKQFAYVASHDLQEPLRKVTSFCELLRDEYRDRLDGEALTYIDYAVSGAQRMKALVADLLDYSRVEMQGRPLAPTSADDALAEAVGNLEMAIEESRASVEFDRLPVTIADRPQLVRVFQNLIGNAIKYRSDARPRVHVWVEGRDSEWVFHVEDNGIGIDSQYFERIFVIFQRLHTREAYAGTGIGLAVCKRIVERFGGRIWVNSTLGNGSDFCFALPKMDLANLEIAGQGQCDQQSVDRFVLHTN